MDERFYRLALSVFPGVGPVRFGLLLKRFGSAKDAWRVTKSDLVSVLGEKTTEKFDKFRQEFSIEGYARKLKDKQVTFLILTDKTYPKLLKEIPDAPFVLYVKGDPSSLHSSGQMLAVVGTRKITNYGREVTRFLVGELAASGFTIVSGLAIGIDSQAHEAAIESGGSPSGEAGKTIAVLGCGVDCCYPSSNQSLYDEIIHGHGAIVSEFPLSQKPLKGSFPSRNRIIAGLSLGVLVTEGAEDSGALITADYAFKNNRKVFAVPGPITSGLSKGPHKLIEKGAKLVTSGEDILQGLGLRIKGTSPTSLRPRRAKGDNKEEEMILKILEREELHTDEIVRRSGMEISKVGSLLSIMEMKGMVRDTGGGVFGTT